MTEAEFETIAAELLRAAETWLGARLHEQLFRLIEDARRARAARIAA